MAFPFLTLLGAGGAVAAIVGPATAVIGVD